MNNPDPSEATMERWRILRKAQLLSELDRHREAAALLHGLLARQPDDANVLCQLAATYLNLGEPGQTIALADQAIAHAPENEWPHRLRSIALLKYDKRAALLAAREAATLMPEGRQALITLTNALLKNGALHEARAVSERLHTLYPDDAETYEMLASVAFAHQWWRDAERLSREALKRDAARPLPLHNLAAALFNSGQYEKAADAATRSLELDPAQAEVRILAARSAGQYLDGRISVGIATVSPLGFLVWAPAFLLIAVLLLLDALHSPGGWGSFWVFAGIALLLNGVCAYYYWCRHRKWFRLSPATRRVYLLSRWGWLGRIAPAWFERFLARRVGESGMGKE